MPPLLAGPRGGSGYSSQPTIHSVDHPLDKNTPLRSLLGKNAEMSDDVVRLYDEADQLKTEGKLDEAVAKLEEAIGIDENYALAHSALAVVLQRQDQHEQAVKHAQRVCEIEPDDPFSFAAMSVTFQRAYAGTNNQEYIRLAEDAMERSRQLGQG